MARTIVPSDFEETRLPEILRERIPELFSAELFKTPKGFHKPYMLSINYPCAGEVAAGVDCLLSEEELAHPDEYVYLAPICSDLAWRVKHLGLITKH